MMNKRCAVFCVFFFGLSLLYGQESDNVVPLLDRAVKSLAADLVKKIPAGETPKLAAGIWTFQDSVPALSTYWAMQLAEELVNLPGRPVTVSGGPNTPEWIVSGEIVYLAGLVRVYTRLVRSSDQSVMASVHVDFEQNEQIADMLAVVADSSGAPVARDAYEPDSHENPYAMEIAPGEDGSRVNRSLHHRGDEDFFLFTPDKDGALVMETTGDDIDTFLEFYEAGSRGALATNDDGGSGGNAMIRRNVQAGNRYIAKVRGYDRDVVGRYGFHVYFFEPVRMTPDEFEDDNTFESAKDIAIGTPQQHTFTSGDDVDWVKFQASEAGTYIIRVRGTVSSSLDTYIELCDSNRSAIDEDDDGGDSLDSRLSARLQTGTYYLKVECLDDEPDQPYTIRVNRE
jgi:hypothetical protein